MNKKTRAPWGKGKLFIFLAAIFVFLFKAQQAFALEIYYPTLKIFGKQIPLNDTSTLPEYGRYFFTILVFLAGLVAVIAVAIGGVYYLVDYARGKVAGEGREWIKSGLVGLLLIVCAYVILDTINPALVTFQLPGIPAIGLFNPVGSSPGAGVDYSNYEEIPMGVLTENLLTRTMDCYGFDPMGNPIDGTIKADDNSSFTPTYLDHDRADCLAQLMDGAQKKTQVIAQLSDAITGLMDTCKCSAAVCSNNCNANGQGCALQTNGLPDGMNLDCSTGQCGGACAKGNPLSACQPFKAGSDCCPAGTKNTIEHGPVVIGGGGACNNPGNGNNNGNGNGGNGGNNNGNGNGGNGGNNNGNTGPCTNGAAMQTCTNPDGSTFQSCECPQSSFNNSGNSLASISNTVFQNSFILAAAPAAPVANNNNCCALPNTTFKGLDEFRCPNPNDKSTPRCDDASAIVSFVEKQVQFNKKTITIIDQKQWAKLNLIQQLTYFQGKIDQLKQAIQKDGTQLNNAKVTLGQCYLAIPSIDLFKVYQETNQNINFISTQDNFTTIDNSNDPNSGSSTVDPAKYCKGFNYNNSSCLNKCDNECPDTSPQAISAYQKCNQNCKPGDETCASNQENCIEQAYNQRPCLYAPNNSSTNKPETFGDCISSCQNDCSNTCSQEYLPCSPEFKYCQDGCDANSQCVLNNAGQCLFNGQNGAQGFVNCAVQSSNDDQGNTDYCISDAYTCQNGSSQYAGYADCADPTKTTLCTSDANCPSSSFCSSNGTCVPDYSSSYFYLHPYTQKCPFPNTPPTKQSSCYSATGGDSSCQQLCPETAKCTVSSKCPYCPCDQVNQTFEFPLPNSAYNNDGSASTAPPTIITTQVNAAQVVGPQCNQYAYNEDPLTFYCENSWWKDPNREGQNDIPIGNERSCSLTQEVPVGQSVDDAENWAFNIINTAATESNYIKRTVAQMELIGNAKDDPTIQNYCKCDAKFANNNPICSTDCQFNSQWIPHIDNNGNWDGTFDMVCGCSVTPCNGSPCEQLIDYQVQLWAYFKQLKTDYVNFYTSMLQDPRSDIMKELTYSRQMTTSANVTQNNFGNQSRMLSCTRAEDEKIPNIMQGSATYNGVKEDSYCYGAALGKLFNTSLTDDWFLCDLQKINSNPTK